MKQSSTPRRRRRGIPYIRSASTIYDRVRRAKRIKRQKNREEK